MSRTRRTGLLVLAVGLTLSAMPAEGAVSARDRAAAEKAALLAAQRQVGEKIKALPAKSGVTVGAMLTGNAKIAAAMGQFVQAVKPVGRPTWQTDRSRVEVRLEIGVREVYERLRKLHGRHYRGSEVTDGDLAKCVTAAGTRRISEIGSARPGGATVHPSPSDARTKPSGYWTESVEPAGIAAAADAARQDARRNLLAKLGGQRINDAMTVRDFAAADSKLRAAMPAIVRSAKDAGPVTYRTRELIADVSVTVRLSAVVTELKTLHAKYYRGRKVSVVDIEKLLAAAGDKTVTAAGSGPPATKYLKSSGNGGAVGPLKPPKWPKTIRATGTATVDQRGGATAQARLKALRAAEADARKSLLSQLGRLKITSRTAVSTFLAYDKRIDADMQKYLRAANLSSKLTSTTRAMAEIKIDTAGLWTLVKYWYKKLGRGVE